MQGHLKIADSLIVIIYLTERFLTSIEHIRKRFLHGKREGGVKK
ncbi:hypothetical protein B14911_09422 [Bacillus sp. NRRL B-14911]|uniref:Uncharacterized protein n=1 Tax=Bacillus infantis NRRL B-14911 TaxID=1367477 RepID=U5LF35_9BACI|nr:hypothetical protein N288_20935 [Bacillus infantis NRRL B-14911]EAR63869.1 hypothetical protein B14911_09422 [Bacillus sp. NRRL B-14911]